MPGFNKKSKNGIHAKDTGRSGGDRHTCTTAYRTNRGRMLVGKIENAFATRTVSSLRGRTNLILTSPPFPLVHKKRYGNETGVSYIRWIKDLAPQFCELLASDGSIVMEIGNSWEPGVPVMSTLDLEALLAFKKAGKLHLSQHIICHNPARLPSPAQWERVSLAASGTGKRDRSIVEVQIVSRKPQALAGLDGWACVKHEAICETPKLAHNPSLPSVQSLPIKSQLPSQPMRDQFNRRPYQQVLYRPQRQGQNGRGTQISRNSTRMSERSNRGAIASNSMSTAASDVGALAP